MRDLSAKELESVNGGGWGKSYYHTALKHHYVAPKKHFVQKCWNWCCGWCC